MVDEKFSGFSINNWETISEDTQLKTPIFNITKRRSRLPAENIEGEFYLLTPPDWINVIATTKEQNVVLVEQFRHGLEKPTLEIPGGMIDPGESPLEASKRELLEETGYSTDHWVDLGEVSVNPAIQTNHTYTFWAQDCELTASQQLDRNERINIHTLPEDEFLKLVRNGTIHHSLVVAAVAKYLLYR